MATKLVNGVRVECTQSDLNAIAEREAQHIAEEPQRQLNKILDARKEAYGSIGDQLDMMYHDKLDGTTTWIDAIAAVKAKYPKPV